MKRFLRLLIVFLLTASLIVNPVALSRSQVPSVPVAPDNGVPVMLDGKTLFLIRAPFASTSPQQRAAGIERRLNQFARNSDLPIDTLKLQELNGALAVVSGETGLVTITDADARAVGLPKELLGREYLKIIRQAVEDYRKERTPSYLFRAALMALGAVILLLLGLVFLKRGAAQLVNQVHSWRDRRIRDIRLQNLEIMSARQLTDWLVAGVLTLRSLISLVLIAACLAFVFNLFPQTRQIGSIILSYFRYGLRFFWNSFLGYLPNLLIIILTILVSYYLIRFLKLLSLGVRRRSITISGFYPEWAEPTYKLLVLIVIAIALVIIFPYLPGSSSPAFQGISIFFGVLLSLGSSSAVSNMVAGFILIYTRAFRLGDFVQVGDTKGTIEEKNILVTRIRTPHNNIVTIPNSTLLSSSIVNYTTTITETQRPLILHANVSLGYDVPWRDVYATLVAAALATPRILSDPPPFVLQLELQDFYVVYALQAHTNEPNLMLQIYSDLYQNIQDKCNEAGIEICSPHYSALRDGNHTTIPAKYLDRDYTAPGFKVERSEGDGVVG